MAVHGRDEVDKAEGCEGPALPGDCEHQAGHDDRGGAVRPTAGDRRAGAAPLRGDLATERRVEASDHEGKQQVTGLNSEQRDFVAA